MARRQGAAGGEGARSRLKPVIAPFHDLAGARAAVAFHRDAAALRLLTPSGAAGQAGPAYYWEILRRLKSDHPAIDVQGILDCGDDAAMAHAALVMGWRDLVLSGKATARARIAALAEERGATVRARRPKVMQDTDMQTIVSSLAATVSDAKDN